MKKNTIKLKLQRGCSAFVVMFAVVGLGPVYGQSATSMQAVKASGFRLNLGAGYNSSSVLGTVGGSYVTPLSSSLGLQIDAIGGAARSNGLLGGAGHIFWREPQSGSLGAYGSYLYGSGRPNSMSSDMHDAKAGVEGSYLVGNFGLQSVVGAEWNNFGSRIRENNTYFFDDTRFNWYATDHLKLDIGQRYTNNRGQIVGGADYYTAFNTMPVSFFVDSAYGGKDKVSAAANGLKIMAGVNFYFGGNAPTSALSNDTQGYMPDYLGNDAADLPKEQKHTLSSSLVCPEGLTPVNGHCPQ